MNPDLRHVRYFLAVAEELNFTRAAARLRIDQPALSRQIQRLERALGVRLFLRTTRLVQLTDAGEELSRHARRLLDDTNRALDEVRRHARPDRLRLGWFFPVRDRVLARIVRSFEATEDATVDLVRYDFTDPSAGLAGREVDAAVINPPTGTKGLAHLPLLTEPRVLIVSDAHPMARQMAVRVADLDRLDVLWAVPPGNDPVWQDYWGLAGTDGRRLPARRIQYEDNQEYLQAVAAGQVLGLSMTGAITGELRDYGIAAIPVTDLEPATITLAWHRDDPNPLLRPLRAAARGVVKEVADRSSGAPT